MLNKAFIPSSLLLQIVLLMLLQDALSWWSSLILVCILSFKYLRHRANQTLSLTTINSLAFLLCLLLMSQLWRQDMQDSMLQLLFFSAALRLCSVYNGLQHAMKLVWVHYFLIATGFMLDQSLVFACLLFMLLFCNLYLHYLLFAPTERPRITPTELYLLASILPFCIALFVLFPRLPPLWQTERQHQAQTGLANALALGGIEQLVQNNKLAFRAEFSGEPPAQHELYWRAKVFERFNGLDWSGDLLPTALQPVLRSARYHYQVIVEPHFQNSLFSLGQVQQMQGQVKPVAAGLIESYKQITGRFVYQLQSDGLPIPQQSALEVHRNLQLQHSNPLASEFALQLKRQHVTATDFARALYQYFRQQQFRYSLRPPLLNKTSQIDQFLFEHKVGFCGHYASSAAYLFRAAGFPARVVAGYQGGTWQAQGEYFQVQQKDAHAWVEYLDEGGWRRFDATSIVAPVRLTQGLSDALSLSERAFLDQWFPQGFVATWLQQLDWLDYYWSVWVLSFDQTEQRNIWHSLKNIRWWSIAAGAAGILLALISWLAINRFANRNQNIVLRQTLLNTLRAYGTKADHQSIESYLTELIEQRPQQLELLEQLRDAYQRFEFAQEKEQLQRCRTLLRTLKKQMNWP